MLTKSRRYIKTPSLIDPTMLCAVSKTSAMETKHSLPWLFSPFVDVLTFLGSALIALGLLAIGAPLGWLHSETPRWAWVVAILMIDVAHVYATGFRVYFDREELKRRPWLYGLTPVLAYLFAWAVYSESVELFWRLLAYLALFHFVRQQYGWVSLYRSRGRETSRIGWWIDASAIYLSMLYPIVYWHCNMPRRFWWFRQGDFASLSIDFSRYLLPVYAVALATYFVRSVYRTFWKRTPNPGKDMVVFTTAVCWYVGVVAFDSDYAFTVTNVIIHGVPYMVLVYWYRFGREQREERSSLRHLASFLGIIWMLAYAEELLWDSGVWRERSWLFGGWQLDVWDTILVSFLAVPQITHYVLDGFIWRRRTSTRLSEMID